MMKKFLFCTLIASLVAFVGCQNEELVKENTDNSGKKVTLMANIQGTSDSRVVLEPEKDADEITNIKVAWKKKDEAFKLYGCSNGKYNINHEKFSQQDETNLFVGTLPTSENGTFYAIYYGDQNSYDYVYYDLSRQNGTLNDAFVLMDAYTDLQSPIEFVHQTAILKPTFMVEGNDIDDTITKIVMDKVHYVDSSDASNRKITIKPLTGNETLNGDIYIHLPMLYIRSLNNDRPEKYPGGYTFDFIVTDKYNNEYTGSLTIPPRKSIEKGKFYTPTIALTETKKDLRYDSATKTFYVSSAKGLMELNQWMISTGDNSHTTFTNLKFSGYESVSSSSRLANNITLENDIELPLKTYNGADITIKNDGTPDNSNWTPLENSNEQQYAGTFDGNNKTISNLVLYNKTSFISYLGAGGIVKNLTLNDVKIISTTQASIAGVASSNRGLIENCHVSGTIRNTKNDMAPTAGGIVFQNQNNGKIINCTNSATVSSNQSAGGIAYQNYGSIIGCMNSGAVTGGSNSNSYVGGVVGWSRNNDAVLVACGNTGAVSAGTNVGGILGLESYSKGVYGCWTLKINATDTDNDGIGSSSGSNIRNCFSAAAKETSQSDKEYINSKVNDMNEAIKNATLPDGVTKYYWVAGTNDWPTLTTTEPTSNLGN